MFSSRLRSRGNLLGFCRRSRFSLLTRYQAPDNAVIPALYKPRQDSWLDPFLLLAGFMPLFTFGLGIWQIKRLKWKVSLIDELEEKLQLPPIFLPKAIDLSSMADIVFRKVIVSGVWDHAHTMLVGPHVREGAHGVRVVTPLIREEGSTILVDRGFVPNDHISKISLHDSEEPVELLAMIRTSQPRNVFTPDNKPESGVWYWIEAEAMAEYAGGEKANVQPLFIELICEDSPSVAARQMATGDPVGREATVTLRNAHLSYVITWFTLSAFTSIAILNILRKKRQTITRSMPRYK